MSDSSQGKLESHFANILAEEEEAWRIYKDKIHRMYNLDVSADLELMEGDNSLRFRLKKNVNLNKFHFLFKLGNILPKIAWRTFLSFKKIRKILFRKKTRFIPVFSFARDNFSTFIYWGEKDPFLSPESLDKMGIEKLLYEIQNPTSSEYSSANFFWPRKLKKIEKEGWIISNLSPLYVFNSLRLPDFSREYSGLFENPFIVVGDREIEISSFHKTICTVDSLSKNRNSNFSKASITLLNREYEPERVKGVYLPQKLKKKMKEGPTITEILLVKRLTISKKKENKYSVIIYPFNSENLLEHEASTPLLTACSLLFRNSYLKSGKTLKISDSREEIKDYLKDLVDKPPLARMDPEKLSMKVLMQEGGMNVFGESIGLYGQESEGLLYFHPAVIECLGNLMEVRRIDKPLLRKGTETINELGNDILSSSLGKETKLFLESQEKIESNLGFSPSMKETRKFIQSISVLFNSFLVFSKNLS